jgi:glycosyltransferase involved in cell wall biosynthesis
MAAYNGEKFLEQQLQSLSKQTRLPAALIVCDDTSSDATADIIKRFSETAPFPVKLVVNEQRLGWRGNFLKSASLCASEYIAFCDQDDIWLPEKLAIVQNCALYLSARLRAYELSSRAQRAAGMLSAVDRRRYKDAGRTGARDAGADLLYGVLGSTPPTAPDP